MNKDIELNNIELNQEFENMNEILKIKRQKLFELQNNNKDPFKNVKYNVSHSTKFIIDNYDSIEGKEVSIAGRMMSKRGMGKASFCDVQDRDEKIQIYVKSDLLGKEQYE